MLTADGTNNAIWHLMGQAEMKPLSSAQIRAARALLRWSAEELSRNSAVSLRTIRRAELAEDKTSLTLANELSIRSALERAGVEFTNGDQPGVRLSKVAATRAGALAVPSGSTSAAGRGRTAKGTTSKR